MDESTKSLTQQYGKKKNSNFFDPVHPYISWMADHGEPKFWLQLDDDKY